MKERALSNVFTIKKAPLIRLYYPQSFYEIYIFHLKGGDFQNPDFSFRFIIQFIQVCKSTSLYYVI